MEQHIVTAATPQLAKALGIYQRVLPLWTFPYLPFLIAGTFQVMAWVGGSTILSNLTLFPRILVLWFFALFEYLFSAPAINAGVEVLGRSESFLVVMYHIMTLVCFVLINTFVFKRPFGIKYLICFVLVAIATVVAHW